MYAFVHLLSVLEIVAHYFHSIHSKLQTNTQTIYDVVVFVVVTVICTKQFILFLFFRFSFANHNIIITNARTMGELGFYGSTDCELWSGWLFCHQIYKNRNNYKANGTIRLIIANRRKKSGSLLKRETRKNDECNCNLERKNKINNNIT